jgi:hypothetical protein
LWRLHNRNIYKREKFVFVMAINVQVTSGKKGSNPGGRCKVSNGAELFSAYYKYCHGSHLNGQSSFNAQNQPVYEALTFELAKKVGLMAPRTYVLLNPKNDVHFQGWKDHNGHDPSGRAYYFLSRIIPHLKATERDPREQRALEKETPYLNGLLISDIIGRRQNYAFTPEGDDGKISYLDLGCSFVHAKEGFLGLHHKLRVGNQKDFRRATKKLKGKKLSTNDGRTIDLSSLVDNLGSMVIPVLNPQGSVQIKDLISNAEIEEIRSYIVQGLVDGLDSFRDANLLS